MIVPVLLLTVCSNWLNPQPILFVNKKWERAEAWFTEIFFGFAGSIHPKTLLKQQGLFQVTEDSVPDFRVTVAPMAELIVTHVPNWHPRSQSRNLPPLDGRFPSPDFIQIFTPHIGTRVMRLCFLY